jgi:hypothetical protein
VTLFLSETTMANMKIIHGRRRELEYQLLAALFTPGRQATAESLKQQLAPRGTGKLRAVGAMPPCGAPPPTLEPIDDQT